MRYGRSLHAAACTVCKDQTSVVVMKGRGGGGRVREGGGDDWFFDGRGGKESIVCTYWDWHLLEKLVF